jgi:hypothetical protein
VIPHVERLKVSFYGRKGEAVICIQEAAHKYSHLTLELAYYVKDAVRSRHTHTVHQTPHHRCGGGLGGLTYGCAEVTTSLHTGADRGFMKAYENSDRLMKACDSLKQHTRGNEKFREEKRRIPFVSERTH